MILSVAHQNSVIPHLNETNLPQSRSAPKSKPIYLTITRASKGTIHSHTHQPYKSPSSSNIIQHTSHVHNADTEKQQQLPSTPPSKNNKNNDSQDKNDDEFEQAFAIFDLSRYTSPIIPPWGAKEAVLGMIAWGASFIAVGFLFIPLARQFAGPGGFSSLSQQDKAIFAFINQTVETIVGLAIVNAATLKYNPLPNDVLRVDVRNPFRKPDGWLAWGLLGALASPAVVYAASWLVEAIGAEADNNARGTADAVSQLLALDPVTFAALFGTTAILAPLLEETVFRGFLLPSLCKAMPAPLAVLLSSIAFGLVHLSPRDTPQLTALGLLLGFSYLRSKNLLSPMLIHGVWNGTVLTVLYVLQASGVDLQEVLHGGKY